MLWNALRINEYLSPLLRSKERRNVGGRWLKLELSPGGRNFLEVPGQKVQRKVYTRSSKGLARNEISRIEAGSNDGETVEVCKSPRGGVNR